VRKLLGAVALAAGCGHSPPPAPIDSIHCVEVRRISRRHTEYFVGGVNVTRGELEQKFEAVPAARADLRESHRLMRAALGLFGSGLSLALAGWIAGVTSGPPEKGAPPTDPGLYYGGLGTFAAGIGLALTTVGPLAIASTHAEHKAFSDYDEAARLAGQCPPPQAGR
jgi:hypothetical protein